MGIFDNMANLSQGDMIALKFFGNMATPPSRIPVPLAYSFAHAGEGIPDYQKQSIDTQMGQLTLDQRKALQPYIMNMYKGMAGNSAPMGVPNSGTNGMMGADPDALAAQSLMAAYASGDQKQVSSVLLSIFEHNPVLAGKIKASQESNTLMKTPQGTYTTVPVGGNSSGSSPMSTSEKSAAPVDLYGADNKPINDGGAITTADDKPILPNMTNLFRPDPTGMPKYKTENTETGVNQTKLFQADDTKANVAFTANAASLQNEQFRLKELADVYKQVQSGTLTAQNPELINKLVAWGVVRDPSQIKDLAGVQNALQSHALQIIQQIKDTNANLGGAPTRTFGSEIQNLQEQGENPGAQPEALWNIIGQARGLVDHHLDMIKGWDSIGGLGNRQANGYTLRPDDYARKFIQHHDITDYKTAAQKNMGPFKGMSGNNSANTKIIDGVTYTKINGVWHQ